MRTVALSPGTLAHVTGIPKPLTPRLWVLGEPDPEMAAIEQLLVELGEPMALALKHAVRPRGQLAYSATHVLRLDHGPRVTEEQETWYLVECSVPVPESVTPIPIDHNHDSNASEFASRSSIGQVLRVLNLSWCNGRYVPCTGPTSLSPTHAFIAAADQCLDAAYRGLCPGVDPDEFAAWRSETLIRAQKEDVCNRSGSALIVAQRRS